MERLGQEIGLLQAKQAAFPYVQLVRNTWIYFYLNIYPFIFNYHGFPIK